MNLIERYINEIASVPIFNWCRNNLFISNGVGDIVPILPTTAQQEIMTSKENNRVYLLPRRSGKTTLICMESIGEAINVPGQHILIAVNNVSSLNYMTRLIANILEASNLMQHVTRVTRERITFTNQSYISIIVPSRSTTRGQKCDVVYVDEFDHIPEEGLAQLFLTIAHKRDGKMLMIGTQTSTTQIERRQIRNMRPITIERSE